MNQTIGVNITPQSFQPTLHYSQGDVGRTFVINVTDYDIPSGATVTCVATKPSGMGFTVSGTVSGNSVTFTSTAEMTDEWGRFPAEIRIASGDVLLGTANFLMIGEKDPHPASTIDGTQEELIPQLTLLVNRVEAAAESVHDLTVSATTLTAGSDATATYDSTNNSIAFGIPRGADGDVTRSEFNDLKSDINDIASVEQVLNVQTISKDTQGIELKDSCAISPDGSISALSSYYTYIYKLEHDGDLYFGNPPTNSAVLMLAVYSGYPSSATFKGTRYRMSDDNLPSASNKLSVSKDEYIAVSVYLNVSVSSLYFSLYEDYASSNYTFGDVKLNADQVEQSNKKQNIYFRYVGGNGEDNFTEKVELYQPTKNGFIRYDVLHSVSQTKNADIWRVGYAYIVDDNFENPIALTVYGEWECALHLNNSGDYSGGIAHGNETLNEAVFFIDGIALDITSYTNITQASEVKILTSSNLYDSTDSARLIAVRGCERILTNEGLTIKQSVKWAVNDNTTWCYMAMNLPRKALLEKFYMNTDLSPKTISYGLFPAVDSVSLFKSGGLSNEFSISKYPTGLNGGDQLLTADNGGNPYAKCYYVVTSGTTVTPSTLWESVSHYRFDM